MLQTLQPRRPFVRPLPDGVGAEYADVANECCLVVSGWILDTCRPSQAGCVCVMPSCAHHVARCLILLDVDLLHVVIGSFRPLWLHRLGAGRP